MGFNSGFKGLISVNINSINRACKDALNANKATGPDVRQRNQSGLHIGVFFFFREE